MPRLLPYWLPSLLLLLLVVCARGDEAAAPATSEGNVTTTSRSLAASSSGIESATCPSRTANYITHTLPQQCLRTDRVSAYNTTINTSSSVDSTTVKAIASPPSISSELRVVDDGDLTSGALAPETAEASTPASSVLATATGTSETVTPTVLPPQETETDSPLDTAHFLSFEEWKEQNLAKVGQSPENLAGRAQTIDPNRRRPVINNALDTLGEESEIELDFSGFGSGHARNEHNTVSARSASRADDVVVPTSQAQPALRSKDAGTTCKERTNYASFDCAATMLKNNPEAKSGSSVLVENKDSYLLNKCAAKNKFIIVELCNDILIDTVVLANYEFFSSIFRHFRISVSDKYPVKIDKWKDLGTFEARNTREVQAFLIENPLIWARYLRIEFLTHYGSEYYCPVSLLRVHGTTMMDEFRHQEELARGELPDDEETLEPEVTAQVSVPQEPPAVSKQADAATVQAIPPVNLGTKPASIIESTTPVLATASSAAAASVHDASATSTATFESPSIPEPLLEDSATCAPKSSTVSMEAQVNTIREAEPQSSSSASEIVVNTTSTIAMTSPASPHANDNSVSTTSRESVLTTPLTSSGLTTTRIASTYSSGVNSSMLNTASSANATHTKVPSVSSAATLQNSTLPAPSVKLANATANATRSVPAVSSSAPAQPPTQESFFKSVSKRLAQLEANSTLSLQYIEAQSLILRDAFSKVEKRQISTTTTFLKHVNDTIMTELHGFRQAYDQLWQSTVLELDGQREQSQREVLALSSRLTLVADELVWQKRMGIVQSTLLLMCLALILFNRGAVSSNGPYSALEIPLLQHMLLKTRSGMDSDPESPADAKSRSPISLFRRKVLRRSGADMMASGDVTDESRPVSSAGPVRAFEGVDTPPESAIVTEYEGVNGHASEGVDLDHEAVTNVLVTPLDSPQHKAIVALEPGEERPP